MDRNEHLDSARSFKRTDKNQSTPEEYDIVVLGSGEGSKYLGWTLAKQGKRVAVIERRHIRDDSTPPKSPLATRSSCG
jgi:choline dehydrogenase-like flavoprotein